MPTLPQRLRARLDREAHRPILPPRPNRGQVARWLLPPELYHLSRTVPVDDQGHGFDPFGMSRDGVAMGLLITRYAYERWFRVRSVGSEAIPLDGPVVLAANHSGMLPLDALMIWTDLVRKRGRAPRAVMDNFVPDLPFVATVFAGGGGIGGSRGNFHAILERGGMILVFPEGTRGIGKGWQQRYRVQPFSEGHAELAIQHRAPVVPVAVVGAEESWPQLARLPVHAFGSPWVPIPATLLPLPVRFHLLYGAPIDVAARYTPADAHDADKVAALAREVQQAVEDLLRDGLASREGLFR